MRTGSGTPTGWRPRASLAPLAFLLLLAACQGSRKNEWSTGKLLQTPPGAPGVRLSFVQVGDLRMRVAEQGTGPLVLLLHGWPESWYSWRHQMSALADAGYRAVAPDLRGFGATDAPPDVHDYDILDLTGDVVGLLDALGEERGVVIGHDWGAAVAWYSVLLHPDRFDGLVALSVPHGERGQVPPLVRLRETFGENFFYMLYFQKPGVAEKEFDDDPRGILSRLLASPDTPREPPKITDPQASAGGWIDRIGEPKGRTPWLEEQDLDYYVGEFARAGFRGGLNYYRNLDRNQELTPQLVGAKVQAPTIFVAGARDLVIGGRGVKALEQMMRPVTTRLEGVHLIGQTGHWVQQERPGEVNPLILDFLESLRESEAAPRPGS